MKFLYANLSRWGRGEGKHTLQTSHLIQTVSALAAEIWTSPPSRHIPATLPVHVLQSFTSFMGLSTSSVWVLRPRARAKLEGLDV